MKIIRIKSISLALLAALLYGLSAPLSKLLLVEIHPTLLAALLYLGAGFGMVLVNAVKIITRHEQVEARMTKKELPYIIGMIVLDIAAPIFLMLALTMTTSSNVSLLNNFEIVATSVIALVIFKEAIGKRMWFAILLITLASFILSIDDFSNFTFSYGSLLVLAACLCWGFENNCTRMLSLKDPLQIVVVKGLGSGVGSLIIYFMIRNQSTNFLYILMSLLLGFVAYGLSIYFYIRAQRELGAARTSTFYAAAPFIGVLISWIILHEGITQYFLLALIIMVIGTYFAITEKHTHTHLHEKIIHEHKHNHEDGHHNHLEEHKIEVVGEHSHKHAHEELKHEHEHMPDLHHRHSHKKIKEEVKN